MKSTKTADAIRASFQNRPATKEELEANRYLVNAIDTYRKRHRITQKQLKERLSLAQKSQAHISRRLSMRHETDDPMLLSELMTFYEAMSYCSAMETSLDNVLKEYNESFAEKVPNYQANTKDIQKGSDSILKGSDPILESDEFIPEDILPTFPSRIFKPSDSLTNSIEDPLFQCWFGVFHCYFYSTLSVEDRCFHGIMTIPEESNNGYCNVNFDFTYDNEGRRHKKYQGQLILSKKTSGAYCTLANCNDQGEISYLVMSNPAIKNKRVCCVLALVLTISGGKDTNHPCVERMIISREELNGDNFELAKSHLLLNDKFIRISEDDFVRLLKDEHIPDSFRKCFCRLSTPFEYPSFNGYLCQMAVIPEAWIKSLPGYSEREHQKLIDLMRLYSIAPKLNKIKQKAAENDIFDMYKDLFSKWDLPISDI